MNPVENTSPQNDLEKVIPADRTIIIAGADFPVRQFKIGRLPAVLKASQPLIHMITGQVKGESLDVISLFVLYSEECLALLAVLADKPREWVDALEQDEAVDLLTGLLEVNLDFFVLRVLPRVKGALESLGEVIKNNAQLVRIAGQMASST
ncbi:hypothetical protein [Undibacterium sp.]|uniref:hypothetical protein n=1 Tax=Undibacterium sp. TaxID=1914977 RepID=UPI00272F5D6C|nr:hypothetical protein [Undibacterium sp.]MDP1980474.1 hypothetical protein [Undibacterium sp.]